MIRHLSFFAILFVTVSAAAETIVVTANDQKVDLFAHPNDTVLFAGAGLKTSSVLGDGKAYGSGVLSVADGADLTVDSDLGPATLRLEGGSTVVFPRSVCSMNGFAGMVLNESEGTDTQIDNGVLQLIGSAPPAAGRAAASAWSPVEFPVDKPFRAAFKCRLSDFCGLSFMVQKAASGTSAVGMVGNDPFLCGGAGLVPSVGIALEALGEYDSHGGWLQNGEQKDTWRISLSGWSMSGFRDADLSVTVEYQPEGGKLLLRVESPNEAAPYSKEFSCGSIAETLGGTSGCFGFVAGNRTPGGSVRIWDFSFVSGGTPSEPDMTQTSAQWSNNGGVFTTYGETAKPAFQATVDNSRNGARGWSVFHHRKKVDVTVPFTVKARIAFPSFCGGIAFLFHNEASGTAFKGTGDAGTDPAVENMGFRTTASGGAVTASTAWGMGLDLRLDKIYLNGEFVEFPQKFRAVCDGDFVQDYAAFANDGIVFSKDDPSVTNEVELTLSYDLSTLKATLKSGERVSTAVFADTKPLYERMGAHEAYFCISDGLIGNKDSGRGCWITDLTYDFDIDVDQGLTIKVSGDAALNASTGEVVAFPGDLAFEETSGVLSLAGAFTADAPVNLTVPVFPGLSRTLADLSAASGLSLADFVLNCEKPEAGVRLSLRNGILSVRRPGGSMLLLK